MIRTLSSVLRMIKFEHTLFALPFAFLGMILAAEGWPEASTVGWIVLAMVGARSAAMAFNRLVDRHIDAENPRTAQRELPAGLVSPLAVAAFVVAGCGLLVFAASRLNRLALLLSPVAIAILLLYSYTKRMTSWCHVVLGLALAGAPLGAWIAVQGRVSTAAFLLGGAVLLWVAGFDVLYALQDLDFDHGRGLKSVPVRFGVAGSLWISGLLHVGMLGALLCLPLLYPPGLGPAYGVGVAGCAVLLLWQHSIVRPSDLSRLDTAFFSANGALASWLFAATAVDILVR